MTPSPPRLPSSWAEICVLKPRLRQQARESGRLSDWRRLSEKARTGTDTLEEWRDLCAHIAEHGAWYGTYAIRDGEDDDDTPTFGCSNGRRCERRAAPGRPGEVPVCHLSGEPMTRSAP
jgi:hypothetical protein